MYVVLKFHFNVFFVFIVSYVIYVNNVNYEVYVELCTNLGAKVQKIFDICKKKRIFCAFFVVL